MGPIILHLILGETKMEPTTFTGSNLLLLTAAQTSAVTNPTTAVSVCAFLSLIYVAVSMQELFTLRLALMITSALGLFSTLVCAYAFAQLTNFWASQTLKLNTADLAKNVKAIMIERKLAYFFAAGYMGCFATIGVALWAIVEAFIITETSQAWIVIVVLAGIAYCIVGGHLLCVAIREMLGQ